MAGIWQVIGVPCVNLSTSETLSHEKVNYIIYHIYIWMIWCTLRSTRTVGKIKGGGGHSFKKLQRQSCPTPRLVWVSVMKHDIKLPVFCTPWRSKQQDFVCLELTKGASMLLPCGWSLLRGVAKSQNCFRRGALTCCLLLPRRLLALCIFWQRSDLVVVFYKSQSSIFLDPLQELFSAWFCSTSHVNYCDIVTMVSCGSAICKWQVENPKEVRELERIVEETTEDNIRLRTQSSFLWLAGFVRHGGPQNHPKSKLLAYYPQQHPWLDLKIIHGPKLLQSTTLVPRNDMKIMSDELRKVLRDVEVGTRGASSRVLHHRKSRPVMTAVW